MQPKLVSINPVIEDTRPMLDRLIREDVEIGWLPGEVGGLVNLDPSRFEQVIVNLANQRSRCHA